MHSARLTGVFTIAFACLTATAQSSAQPTAGGAAGDHAAPANVARGIRELRAHYLPSPLSPAWVAATDEGLVELGFDARAAIRTTLSNPSHGAREFYEPDDVLEWIKSAGALLRWAVRGPDESTPPASMLGRDGGSRLELRGSIRAGRRIVTVAWIPCRVTGSPRGTEIDRLAIVNMVAQFRRAAYDAQAVPRHRAPDDAVWYEHAVACPANRLNGSAPLWPHGVPPSFGPHEEIVEFVVDRSGGVEEGSERFLPSGDPRFAAPVRRALRSWRFQPARRAAYAVRELVHYSMWFTPPVVLDRSGRLCPSGAVGASTRCDSLFVAFVGYDIVTAMPQGNGMVRIANAAEVSAGFPVRDHSFPAPPYTRVELPASEFRQWLDTVTRLLPTIATDSTKPSLPNHDYAAGAPMIGTQDGLGLNMWLSSTGWIRAGFLCGHPGMGQARFLEVEPRRFAAFRRIARAAVDRVALQPRWASRGERPFLAQELTCDVALLAPLHDPVLPPSAAGQASREAVAGFVVDTTGHVEPRTIEVMAAVDSTSRRAIRTALAQWAFIPAIARGRRVRAQEYVTLILRPPDGDAVVLAAAYDTAHLPARLSRTVFFKGDPEPSPPPLFTSRDAWQRAIAEMQPYVDHARRTWPSVRAWYAAGPPLGMRLFVTVRLTDILGDMEHVSVLVDRIAGDTIHGRIDSDVRTIIGWRRGDVTSLNQSELVDWMIVGTHGTVEGDVVGQFLNRFRQSPPTLPPTPSRPPAATPPSRRPDTATGASGKPPWQGRVRYGGGPSVGAPWSDFTGKTPPARWCLRATTRASGDFGVTGRSWIDISRDWLREVLSDTTSLGDGWRGVLGGAPLLQAGDSLVQIFDEAECHRIAQVINRDLLGWQVGPPPVVVLRVRGYLVAFPSNARMGEFGMAVGLDARRVIRGVATW